MSSVLALPQSVNCAIIGAGPAGLIASIYLARFRRSLCLFDAGGSRASWIPTSHNLPGFPDGISGADFLARLRAQAARYGVSVTNAIVESIRQDGQNGGGFIVRTGKQNVRATHVILATGAVDIEPDLPKLANAVQRGLIRHCPICDAFEAIDQTVGVIGNGDKLVAEARFLRDYTEHLSVYANPPGLQLSVRNRHVLQAHGIRIVEAPVTAVMIESERIIALALADGSVDHLDTLYSALGSVVRSDLASALAAKSGQQGDLLVHRKNMATSVPGLYAVGDVVSGLSQISVAAGHAALAATAIHHQLRKPRVQ